MRPSSTKVIEKTYKDQIAELFHLHACLERQLEFTTLDDNVREVQQMHLHLGNEVSQDYRCGLWCLPNIPQGCKSQSLARAVLRLAKSEPKQRLFQLSSISRAALDASGQKIVPIAD